MKKPRPKRVYAEKFLEMPRPERRPVFERQFRDLAKLSDINSKVVSSLKQFIERKSRLSASEIEKLSRQMAVGNSIGNRILVQDHKIFSESLYEILKRV